MHVHQHPSKHQVHVRQIHVGPYPTEDFGAHGASYDAIPTSVNDRLLPTDPNNRERCVQKLNSRNDTAICKQLVVARAWYRTVVISHHLRGPGERAQK